jgi:hypothetical protein
MASGCGLGGELLSKPENTAAAPVTASQNDDVISEESAAEILTDYLLTQGLSQNSDPALSILMDRTDEAGGLKYYVFHVFDNMEDHAATLGWYGVQVNDGSLYDFMLMAPIDTAASAAFTFDVDSRSWNEEGITVKYLLLVNSSDPDKAGKINDLIMDDMSRVLETIKDNNPDDSITIDGVFEYETPSPSVLSIGYNITYFGETLAYPVDVFHSITISLDAAAIIPLSDLFVIDESFVEAFKMGMYAPHRDDLDLEVTADSMYELIGGLFSNEELSNTFLMENAAYRLTGQGIVLSIDVAHMMGDHLEMAVNFENLESNIRRDHPFWNDYMFLDEPAG